MSSREKNLLIFFATVGFLILNGLAVGMYQAKHNKLARQHEQALAKLENAEKFRASRELVTDQMDWLAKHEPPPASNQDVQTKLQQFCETEAKSTGLIIKAQNPLASDTTEGLHFHRAKIEFTVNGPEDALYRWLDHLNIPEQLRIASSLRISPNTQDDTQIDCKAVVEQWFVPAPPSSL